jgi:hypothetical protein
MKIVMNRLGAASVFLLLVPACHATFNVGDGVQGNGVARTETRDVAAFQTIELDGAGRLELVAGPPGKLSITGDENILPLITTTVSDGKLVVNEKQGYQPKTPLVISLSAPNVSRIEANGAGTVHVTGLTGASFALASRGASSADLTGQVDKLDIDVGGAGRIRASGLVAREAHVGISGAGSVEVNATEKLKADVSGVGAVKYRGSPSVEKNVTGVGSVSPLG